MRVFRRQRHFQNQIQAHMVNIDERKMKEGKTNAESKSRTPAPAGAHAQLCTPVTCCVRANPRKQRHEGELRDPAPAISLLPFRVQCGEYLHHEWPL